VPPHRLAPARDGQVRPQVPGPPGVRAAMLRGAWLTRAACQRMARAGPRLRCRRALAEGREALSDAAERACAPPRAPLVLRRSGKAGRTAAARSFLAPALPGACSPRPRAACNDPAANGRAGDAPSVRPHRHAQSTVHASAAVARPHPMALPWQARPPRARARAPRWATAPAAPAARSAHGRPGTRAAGPGPGRTARCRRPAC